MKARTTSLVMGIAIFLSVHLSANAANSFDNVPKPTNLDWRAIESDDYRTYITNLHAVGCPAQTIRDIVTADVVSVFGPRREEAINVRFQDYQFWKANPAQTDARATFELQHASIDADMNRVIRELLGSNAPLPDIDREWQRLVFSRKLNFLDPDKRAQTTEILLRSEKLNNQIKELSGGFNLSEDTKELQRVLSNFDAEKAALSSLLSSNEFDLVQLNTSWTSENLRRAMVHFEPIEVEFRVIFAAWLPHDENLARLRANRQDDPGNAKVYAEIKEKLSADRYDKYCATWWN